MLLACLAIHTAQQPVPWSERVFFDCVTEPYCLFACLGNTQVQGYAILLQVLDEVTLMDIAVDACCQNSGVASALMRHILHWSTVQKAASVLLEVRASNRVAKHLYDKFGFSQQAIRKNYYANAKGSGREDAIIMQYNLRP